MSRAYNEIFLHINPVSIIVPCTIFSCMQSEYRKIQTRKNSYLDTFHAVMSLDIRQSPECASEYTYSNAEKKNFHVKNCFCIKLDYKY